MRLLRGVIKATHQANCRGNIISGLGKKVELADLALKLLDVSRRGAHIHLEKKILDHRSGDRVAMRHAEVSKYLGGKASLSDDCSIRRKVKLHTKRVAESTHVGHVVGAHKFLHHGSHLGRVITKYINVVDVQEEQGDTRVIMEKVQVGVGSRFDETKLADALVNVEIPTSRRLAEPVESFVKLANLMRVSRVFKALRLDNVDIFLELAVEKGGGNVKMVNSPAVMTREHKKSAKSVVLGHWSIGLVKIQTFALLKTTGHKAGF
jgi:hypothetical protein